MIDVYWSQYYCDGETGGTHLLSEPPELVAKDLIKGNHIKGAGFKMYSKCNAYIKFFQNTYVIKSNFDLDLQHTVDSNGNVGISSINKTQKFFDEKLSILFYEKEQQLIQPSIYTIFFSESDISISQSPAFFHNNDFTNNTVLAVGEMNISKWYRPLQPAFFMKNDTVDIKVGDALYYVKFNTDEKIRFRHYDTNDKLNRYHQECTFLKEFKSNIGLKKLYSMFTKRNYNKKILTEIKKNLTGDFE
jgi:hypothetical protein